MKFSAKNATLVAATTALLIAVQYALSFVPGVELVTVTFVAFCCVFGKRCGALCAVSFAVLRQLVFGIYLPVLVLYLIYFNALSLCASTLKKGDAGVPTLWKITLLSIVATLAFTLTDNVITPLWFGYGEKAFWLYFKASIPFALIQCACVGTSTAVLFKPLSKIFLRFAN